MTSVGSVYAWMADSPEEVWSRDELVLVLDLYVRHAKRPALEVRQALDDALRSFRRQPERMSGGRRSLERKLLEFAGLDPKDPTPDRLAAAAPERAIWDEFANDRVHLRSEAKAARTRVYDVVAFLQARTEPVDDPGGTNARFRVVECTPDSVTYRRVGTSIRTGTVGTAALQEILDEVLDQAYGGEWGESFEVSVDPRFWRVHKSFADAVVAAIAGRHVFREWMYNGVAVKVASGLKAATPVASQARMSEPVAWRTLLVGRDPERLGWHMSPLTNRRMSPNASLSLPIQTSSSEAREAMRVYRTDSPPTWSLRGWFPSRPPPAIRRSTLHGGTGQTSTLLRSRARLRATRSIRCVSDSDSCSATDTLCPPVVRRFTRRSMWSTDPPIRGGPSSANRSV